MSERDKRLTNEELEKFILCLDCLADKIIEHAMDVKLINVKKELN